MPHAFILASTAAFLTSTSSRPLDVAAAIDWSRSDRRRWAIRSLQPSHEPPDDAPFLAFGRQGFHKVPDYFGLNKLR